MTRYGFRRQLSYLCESINLWIDWLIYNLWPPFSSASFPLAQSWRGNTFLLAHVPVPLGDLVPCHANLVCNLALELIGPDVVLFEIALENLHLVSILAHPSALLPILLHQVFDVFLFLVIPSWSTFEGETIWWLLLSHHELHPLLVLLFKLLLHVFGSLPGSSAQHGRLFHHEQFIFGFWGPVLNDAISLAQSVKALLIIPKSVCLAQLIRSGIIDTIKINKLEDWRFYFTYKDVFLLILLLLLGPIGIFGACCI